MRIVMLAVTIGLVFVLADVSARAGLLDPSDYLTNPSFANPLDATSYVANPSFETPPLALSAGTLLSGCNYQTALPTDWIGGWTTDPGDGGLGSLRHYRPHTSGLKSNYSESLGGYGYFWDPTEGVNGAAVILRNTIPTGWFYQSLGAVGQEDIGLIFVAMIDSSTRVGPSANYQGERRVSFRTGVTGGGGGNIGDLVSMDLDTATRQASDNDPWHRLVDWFRPTREDIGKEIFLVFSAHDVTTRALSAGQYQFDNVRLWVVPEPGTMGLVVVGLVVLLTGMGRGSRKGSYLGGLEP